MEIYVPKLSNVLATTHEIKKIYLFDINSELDVLARCLTILHVQVPSADLIPHVLKSIINGSNTLIEDLYSTAFAEYRVHLKLEELDFDILANTLNIVSTNITNKVFSLCVKDDLYLFTSSGCFEHGVSLLYLDVRLEANLIVGIV